MARQAQAADEMRPWMCVKMGGRICGKRLIIHLSASKSVNRMNEVRGKLAGKYDARPGKCFGK